MPPPNGKVKRDEGERGRVEILRGSGSRYLKKWWRQNRCKRQGERSREDFLNGGSSHRCITLNL